MTPPAKTLMGSKINYFQGSIALCHTGSIARGFSKGHVLLSGRDLMTYGAERALSEGAEELTAEEAKEKFNL